MTAYPVHPVAALFPMLGEAELRELAEDIREHGLIEAIVVRRGVLLDGRNRLAACELAGVDPDVEEWHGDDEDVVQWILGKNLHRRHLTASQRAMIAARLATGQHGTNQHTRTGNDAAPPTQAEAAAAVHVSERSVRDARAVLESGDEDLAQAVDRGDRSVSDAAAEVRERSRPPAMPPPVPDRRDTDGRPITAGRRHTDHCVCPRCERNGAGAEELEDEPVRQAPKPPEHPDLPAAGEVWAGGSVPGEEDEEPDDDERPPPLDRAGELAAIRRLLAGLDPDRDELREVLGDLAAADVRAAVKPERRENDAYYTPDHVALALVRWLRDQGYLPRRWSTRILEPHVGGGAWVRALQVCGILGHLEALDIDGKVIPQRDPNTGFPFGEVGDFLTYDWGDRRFELIVGNPPFLDSEAHVRRALSLLAPRGILAWILRRDWIGPARGALIAAGLAPVEEVVLEEGSPDDGYRRLSFTDNNKSDSREHSLFVWRQGAQRLHWRTRMLAIPGPKRGGSRAV